jgi:hypothetical protein
MGHAGLTRCLTEDAFSELGVALGDQDARVPEHLAREPHNVVTIASGIAMLDHLAEVRAPRHYRANRRARSFVHEDRGSRSFRR